MEQNKRESFLTKQIKQQFIKRQIEHVRLVQDNMILLEINKDKLPFHIDDWKLLQRGMQHDMDKFQDNLVNDFAKIEEYHSNKRNNISNDYIDKLTLYDCCDIHYNTQPHHQEYHISHNIPYSPLDICEFCCDVFASAKRHDNSATEYFLTNILPNNEMLQGEKDNVLYIFNLLTSLNNESK